MSTKKPYAFAKTQPALLTELAERTGRVIGFGESLRYLPEERLNARPGPKRWSALECLEHLNRYAEHYLPQLEAKAVTASQRKKDAYRPGLLGKPFALALHPDNRKTLRSPAAMNALGSSLDAKEVLTNHLEYQHRYAAVIDALEGKSLRGSRIPLSLSRLLRFHLGDVLTTLVWHNERHTNQAREAVGEGFG